MTSRLLAVDLGLRTGLALFDERGRVVWYRSHHVTRAAALERIAHRVLSEEPEVTHLIAEGDRRLFEAWEREAARRTVLARRIGAEAWRGDLLHQREQRDTKSAKRAAETLARRYLEVTEGPRPKALRHDTAEAILIGVWGCLELGWLERLPPDLARGR